MYGGGIINDDINLATFLDLISKNKVQRMNVNSGGGYLFDITVPDGLFTSLTSQNVTNVTNVICKIVVFNKITAPPADFHYNSFASWYK